MSEVVEALKEAKALVAAGWVQGRDHDESGYCTVGAVYAAAPPGGIFSHATMHTMAVTEPLLKAAKVHSVYWLRRWNDTPERTQSEVLALFDRAIELAA